MYFDTYDLILSVNFIRNMKIKTLEILITKSISPPPPQPF